VVRIGREDGDESVADGEAAEAGIEKALGR
jgi:hypothetical protein